MKIRIPPDMKVIRSRALNKVAWAKLGMVKLLLDNDFMGDAMDELDRAHKHIDKLDPVSDKFAIGQLRRRANQLGNRIVNR